MENQNKLTDEQVEVISKTLEDSKSEENKNERTEIIKNIEIKKWNQESHETR